MAEELRIRINNSTKAQFDDKDVILLSTVMQARFFYLSFVHNFNLFYFRLF